jgi:hypothetical protein
MEYFTEEFLSGIKWPSILEGYSSSEIEKAERESGIKFPKAYKEFLHLMGKQVSFLQGIDYSMHDLKHYKEEVENYLRSNFGDIGLGFLKSDDIVFASSQGCNHFYISSSKGENPQVNFINEGMKKLEPILGYESFTEFVKRMGNV